jgi:hypothetical protein
MKMPPEGTSSMRGTTAHTLPTVEPVPIESSRHHPYLTTAILTAIPFAVAILALQTCDEAHRAWFAEEDNVAENLQVVFLLIATWAAGSVARSAGGAASRSSRTHSPRSRPARSSSPAKRSAGDSGLFGIATPEALSEVNIQHELTLHNTYLLTPVFSFAQLVIGFLPALAALTPWQRLLPPRWNAWRRAFVPGPALASWFLLIGAWRLYRYAFLAPGTPAWIGEFSEIPELTLYAGLALFALDQRRYVRVARERLA